MTKSRRAIDNLLAEVVISNTLVILDTLCMFISNNNSIPNTVFLADIHICNRTVDFNIYIYV